MSSVQWFVESVAEDKSILIRFLEEHNVKEMKVCVGFMDYGGIWHEVICIPPEAIELFSKYWDLIKNTVIFYIRYSRYGNLYAILIDENRIVPIGIL